MEAELSVCNVDVPLLKRCLQRLLVLFDCLSQIEDEHDGTLRLRLWTHHKKQDSLKNAQVRIFFFEGFRYSFANLSIFSMYRKD